MKKTIFTENQKKAHDYYRHIAVIANAGSGKTTVLANRFLNILLETDTKVEEIVAITFTDKAAGELKNKIATLIENLINNATDQRIKNKCKNIRAHLASANISTIHSFCAKILRLNPIEANVDVAFTILEGVDRKILIDEAINETISDILKKKQDEFQLELISLLRNLTKRKVIYILNFLIEKREQVQRLVLDNGLYINSDDHILAFWNHSIKAFVIKELNPEKLLSVLKDLKLPELHNHISNQLKSLTTDANNETILNILSTTAEALRNFLEEKNTPNLVNNTDLGNLKSYVKKIDGLKGYFENLESNKSVLNYTRTILKLYNLVLKKYEELKVDKNYLDYDDLQLKTRELLKNQEVKNFLANKYKFIMIDEYQDTNFLQYEIFLPLLNDLTQGNLFIVGDPKQSIFGFRNAEVEVFEKTVDDITRSTNLTKDLYCKGEPISSTQEEKSGRIVLNENFRLLTDIVAFINLVFSKLMGDVEHEFDVNYQELIRGRNNQSSGRVELMLNILESSREGEENDDESSDAEYEMIARRILKLKSEAYQIFETNRANDSEEIKRDFDFGDAAILLRSRTYLKKLEYWLNRYKIPYIISGGIGFYQTQEIYDFYNYFQFLLNNHDEVALVGILRSPFFSVSDAELYEIVAQNQETRFWEKVQNYARKDCASLFLKRAVKILSDNIKYAARVPIPILVQRIFRQTGWIGTIAGLQRGEQSKLNLEKLLNIAREFEGKGFTNLFDFVERLKALIEKEEREGQASISKDRRAVQIMTIHSAKGLEFPVVFIPFLHKRFRFDSSPYMDTKYGIGFEINLDIEENVRSPIFNFLKHRAQKKTIAEEKRLLYVACTRARDMLILSGTLKNSLRKNMSYLNWIIDALGINQFHFKNISFPKQKIKSIVYEDNKFVPREFEHDLNIHIISSLKELETSNFSQSESYRPVPIKKLYIQSVQAHLKNNFYSATQIQTYYSCPMKYFLKYQLGFPERGEIYVYHEEAEPDDRLHNEKVGLGVHKVLEVFNVYSENEIKSFLSSYLPGLLFDNQMEHQSIVENILLNVKNYFSSDIYRKISKANEFKNEFTINSKFGENFITGTIDKLIKNENGEWLIIDYKTDRIKDGEDLEHKAKKYYYQLGFYALLMKRLFNQSPIDALLIFTNRVNDNVIKFRFDVNDLKRIAKSIEDAIGKITKNDFKQNKEMCEYCLYLKNGKCIGENILKPW